MFSVSKDKESLSWLTTYHINNHFPQSLSLFLGQVDKDITVRILQQFEGHCQMMVLQDRLIIVDDGQLGAGVDQVLVGDPGVVHVMDAAGQDGGHHLTNQEPVLVYIDQSEDSVSLY